ncbi:MAG: radical SAM protein [Desulfobacteraceae bacterium]|nr:radical SAM protein [Desulfobacteraceae bacterium]
MGKYNFDGHKLAYHPERVSEYLRSGDCFPLYVEISPVGGCNHRCLFCAYDFIGHPNRRLTTGRLLTILTDMAACGVKSIVFAGEGEPLLHPDIAVHIAHAKAAGIDIGLFTNGQLLNEALAIKILPHLSFVRFSFNGGTAQDYATVHQVAPKVFETVVDHLRQAVILKKSNGWEVDIGAQFVLIPENKDSLLAAAALLKDAGLDYLAVKPFVHQRSEQFYHLEDAYDPADLETLFAQLNALSDDHFSALVRTDAFMNSGPRTYKECRGCSFITVLNSAGDLASCLPYWDKPEFVFGNIYEADFRTIWQSHRRKQLQHFLESTLDVSQCPANCRPNAINAFLSEISKPSVRHVNFI